MNEWSAEDLMGKDLEYVEWAGEYQLFSRLNERLVVLKSIEKLENYGYTESINIKEEIRLNKQAIRQKSSSSIGWFYIRKRGQFM